MKMGSENILHFAAVRLRVNGAGNLRMMFLGLDDVASEVLVPLVMASAPGREPTRLCNFQGQRSTLRISTTALDEVFTINRIIVFAKELWSGFAE